MKHECLRRVRLQKKKLQNQIQKASRECVLSSSCSILQIVNIVLGQKRAEVWGEVVKN